LATLFNQSRAVTQCTANVLYRQRQRVMKGRAIWSRQSHALTVATVGLVVS